MRQKALARSQADWNNTTLELRSIHGRRSMPIGPIASINQTALNLGSTEPHPTVSRVLRRRARPVSFAAQNNRRPSTCAETGREDEVDMETYACDNSSWRDPGFQSSRSGLRMQANVGELPVI